MKRLGGIFIILAFSTPAFSWWSIGGGDALPSTHNRITTRAVELLRGVTDYPDIDRFGDTIIGATSGPTDDKTAHGWDPNDSSTEDAGRFNGGNFNEWWRKSKDDLYKNSKFDGDLNAYYRIGSMAHLVEDQAVPAHAANIIHGIALPDNPDGLEYWTDSYWQGPGTNIIAAYSVKDPIVYYYDESNKGASILINTQKKLSAWTWPGGIQFPVNTTYWTKRPYWSKNENAQYAYVGQAFNGDLANPMAPGGWGEYGGTAGQDFYTYGPIPGLPLTAASGIAHEQLDMATTYAAGMLMAVSKSLPPLVQSPSLNSAPGAIVAINPGQNNTINFTLLDNRTSIVTYRLVVDDISSSNDIISLSSQTAILADNPDLTSLPKSSVTTLTWNGLLASGSTITARSDGMPHTLYISGTDEDQNLFDYVIGSFTVTGAPFVTVATPLSTLYTGFSGISSLVPGAVNLVGIDYANITVAPNGSPLTQLQVKRPDGTYTTINAPLAGSTHKVEHLTDGRHEVTVLDAAGNRTFVAFNMGTLEAIAAPGESTSTYNSSADKFSAQFKFHMRDWFPLEKASLFDGSGALLRTDALTTPAADITYTFPDMFSTEGFTRDFNLSPSSGLYTIKLYNKEGHEQDSTFALAGASSLFFTRSDIDLVAAAGFIPGVLGRTKPEWLGADVNVKWDVPVTGPLVNSQEVGIYKASVLTGDKADFSDAVEQTLGTRSYAYSVWDYRNQPPQNCGSIMTAEDMALCQDGTYTPEQCAGYVLCHSDAIMQPTALKRYNRPVSTVYPAEFAGVFTYFCGSVVDGNCEAGYHPEITAPLTGSGLEAWGVSYGGGGGYRLDGGLRAAMPAGNNVTVKLADWLSLTFETVTKDWSVGASLRSIPSLPGMLPLRTLTISGAEGAYTGNVSVSLKYDAAGITDGQINYMEALKINNAVTRDFTRRTALVDKPNHTAVFNTPDLGDFMIEVPSYPAPYAYASAELIGTMPELSLLAGEPGATMTLVQSGSPMEQNYSGILNSHGLVPAGDAYILGPTGKKFATAAAVKLLYDKAVIPVRKLREPTLAIYQVSEDGAYISKLGNAVLNTTKGEITAEVSEFHSIFVIAGSTEPAPPAPLLPDVSAPVSDLAFGIPAYETGGMVLISSASPVFVDAYDPPTAGKITSGLATSYYLLDVSPASCVVQPTLTGPSGTCLNPIYSGPFTLSAGTHTVWYKSEDSSGNMETGGSKTLYVDGDAPLVTVSAGGQAVAPGGTAYITEADSVTLTSLDPALSGPSSGVGMTVFDVSTFTCTGFANYPRSLGVCRKILYTEPFALPVGTHTIYYSAMDNAGNTTAVKSVFVSVERVKRVNFYPAVKSVDSILWQWELVEGATGYQVFSSTDGGEALSGVLTAGATVYPQTGLQPNTSYTASLFAYIPEGIRRSAIAGATTLANAPMAAESFLSGQNASVVLGQASFYDRNSGSGPGQFTNPSGLAMDGAGNLWVADSYNHRVLRYSPPFTTGKSADLVIGQTSLYLGFTPAYVAADNVVYPRSITFDRNGKLWVADGRNRVLRFTPPFITGMSADLVIGADNFTSWPSGPVAANRFCSSNYRSPYIGSDASGSLWVSDSYCHRVLRFSEPFYNGMPANLVLGQQDFSSYAGTWPPNERAFSYPAGMGFDLEDNIWVADVVNLRVLKFERPYVSGKAAALVVGQPDFYAHNTTEWNSVSRNKLYYPNGADFDGQGNLYVADDGNNRVVQFRPPFSNGMDADIVIGQPNFNSRTAGAGPSSFGGDGLFLEASGFVYTDPQGRIWVSDRQNQRVMLFEPGGNRSFNAVGNSSFTLQWDSAFNSAQTVYLAEISQTPDFASGVTASGEITSVSHSFTGLEEGVRYYSRVQAKNLDGIYTDYLNLGSIQLKPVPPGNLSGVAVSSSSIIWNWTPGPAGTYQAFSSTGGILSGVLGEGTSWYLQVGLAPNTTYSCFIRITTESGEADSVVSSAVTGAPTPGLPQFLTNGQAADYVLGQTNFVSAVSGRTASAVGSVAHAVTDKSGNLWVTDEGNCRILKFEPPFSAGMSASLVIGAANFTSMGCIAARNRLNSPRAAAFDAEGRLWVSDAGGHRVLMFNPPFSNGMDADLVIGQADFTSYLRSSEPYGLDPAGLALDKEGSLWVADSYNSRVMRFSPPFYNGMPAASSVGYYAASTNSGSLRNPEGVAIDSEGGLWVADTGNNRIMEFIPPFSAGMQASVIIGRLRYAAMPDSMASPKGLAFDSDGNLYVADGYARVLAYKKPFSMYMNASVVLGQNDLYSFVRGLSTVLMNASVYGVTAGSDGRVWVADRNNKRALGFRRRPFTDIWQGSLMARWDAGANPPGTLYRVEVASSPDYAAAIVTEWIGNSYSTISGLLPGTTYYARVKAKNFAGVASEPRDLGVVETLPVPLAYSRSGALVGGKPEVSLASLSQMSVVPADGGTTGVQVAIGAAVSQGLITASPMYNIGPEGTYDPPVMMSFYYSSSAVAAMGIPEPELAVYEYFAGTGWVRLDGQILDTFNKKISVPLTHIASLFGIFVKVEDWAPPATEFVVTGSSYTTAAYLYIGTSAVISLSALDPVVYGTSSGVAFTEFRVDASSLAPFTVYLGPIVLSTGAHRIEFRSGDAAGNIEDVRAMDVIVDGEAPTVSYAIAGSSFPVEDRLYVSAGSTVTLAAVDAVAGVKALSYELNGSTYAVVAGSADIQLSAGGEYRIRYSAEDNVDNAAEPGGILVEVDTTAPYSLLQLNGIPDITEWYASGVVVKISGFDSGSGVKRALYSLDGSSFAVYSATFPVLAEGGHSLEFYSKDNVSNAENIWKVSFGIDLSTPVVSYSYVPEPNGEGWNNTRVEVVFTGTDAASGIAYCSSSFTVSGEGLGIPVSGYCADYAGWTSTASFSVNIDTTAPSSNAEIAAEHGLNGWLLSPAGITLISTDSLSGLGGLYYSVDGSSFALYSSSFAVSGEGAHILKYYSVDRAGNKETEKELAFKLDLNVPTVIAAPGPMANSYGWNNTAVTAVFSGTDTISGLAYCESEKIVAIEGSSQTVTGYCSDYSGWSSTATLTISIDTTVPNLSYVAEPAPNAAGWNNSEVALRFACADGLSGIKYCPADIRFSDEELYISTAAMAYDYAGNLRNISVAGINIDKTVPVSTATVSGAYINGWYSSTVTIVLASTDTLSGVGRIIYRLEGSGEGGVERVSVGPVIVGANGVFKLYYYAEDIAGNKEAEKIIEFKIDASAPSADYILLPAPSGGWNNSAVQVVFAGTDTLSGIDMCSSETVAVEGVTQKVSGWCRDLAGNIGYSTATLNIDLTQPVVSAGQVPVPNTYGWNNTDVTVSFECLDDLSGIAGCPGSIAYSAEGIDISTSVRAWDLAGNYRDGAVSDINIDKTPPVSTAALSGIYNNGYYGGTVAVTITSTDTLSGVARTFCSLDGSEFSEYQGHIEVIAEGRHVVRYYAQDKAGNTEAGRTLVFNIDATAPIISYSIMPPANPNGWNNSAAEGVFTGTDTLSRVASCTPGQIVSVEGSGQTVVGSCTDLAGNVAYSTAIVSVDLSVPEVSASGTPAANAYGWNNSAVAVVFGGTDTVSGIAYCSPEKTAGVEGSSQPISGYCIDYAGLSSTATYLVDIDKTPAISTATLSGPYRNGWYSSAVGIVLESTDALSGVKQTYYSLDGAAYAGYSRSLNVSEEGAHELRYYAVDKADNEEIAWKVEFKIDKQAPSVGYTLDPQANAAGWNRSAVSVVFSGTDTLSGIAYCSPEKVISVEGASQAVTGYCADYAGNFSTASIILNIDITEPLINISSPAAGALFTAGRDKLEIRLAIEDNLDPAPSLTAELTQIEDKGAPRGSRPASIAVVNGQLIHPLNLDDGLWRLEVGAKDIAGNSTQAVSGLFEVVHDTMPPQTSLSVGVPVFVTGGSTFITSHTPLLFSATDDMLLAGDRSGVGVAATYVYVDSLAVAAEPAGSFIAGESTHTVSFFSVDLASNSEAAHSAVFAVDDSSPISAIVFSSAATAGAGGGFVIPKGSSISFSSIDMPAGLASGVSAVWYSVDSGTASVFGGSFSLAVGSHTITYWSLDNLGNTESGKSVLVSVAGESAWGVSLKLEPSTLNLNSKGESVTAKIWTEGSGQACFRQKTINISAINGRELKKPIYTLGSKGSNDNERDHEKRADDDDKDDDDRDKEKHSGRDDDDDIRCGSITIKFDREALIAVLPVNAISSITVSGILTDGRGFSAGDTIRTIKPRKTTRKDGGRFEHQKRAAFDAPAWALKEDGDLYVLSVEGDLDAREPRKDGAAKTRGITRRGSAYEFGPDGAAFDKPVTISLPYEAGEKSPEKLAIAYWNEHAGLWEIQPSRRDTSGHIVKADVPHFSQYQVVAASYAVSGVEAVNRFRASQAEVTVSAADPAFRLGEVYVYPNPAKGPDTPILHIECGIAETVNIKIYTVSGREAHEYTITGAPAIIDDGNGQSYAYEYPWRGHIPSGVYLYAIEAQKAGQKLKKTGKFAVVR